MTTQTLLTTFLFPQPIANIIWDPTERVFFAAALGASGAIHQVNLFRRRTDRGGLVEAVGGAGVTDVVRIDEQNEQDSMRRLLVVEYVTACRLLCHPYID
jgi:pre-rRNA-processing protein IPI3